MLPRPSDPLQPCLQLIQSNVVAWVMYKTQLSTYNYFYVYVQNNFGS